MSSNTPDTVWYRNVTHGTLHEVVAKSALEKRLKREQREVYVDGEDEPTFEPAYERVSAADVKKAAENPEKQPGYPAAQEAKRAAREAEKERQAKRDEALDAAIAGQAQAQTAPADQK